MMRRLALPSLLLCAAAGIYAGCQVAVPLRAPPGEMPPGPPKSTFAKAMSVSTPVRPPVPIVELGGSGFELGDAHGRHFSAEIRLLHERYLRPFIEGDLRRALALSAADGFASHLSPAHRQEIEALARGSGIDPRETMLAQCFLDLTAMTACSTIALPAAAAPDGVARFGRNLDFPSLDVADRYTTLFICRPAGKNGFASVGWPGMIGVLSGMNEHGLALANMEVTRAPRLPSAMPYTLLYRTVLEECRTVDEAIALLERTPRQTSNNLMVMDADGARAVLEISPDRVTVRHGDEGRALISTNHRRGQDDDAPGRCNRYDALHGAADERFGQIDTGALQRMLATASQGNSTLQSMAFEPSERVLRLSAGKDAARGAFQRIDLRTLFR